jgi:hypothetical protein
MLSFQPCKVCNILALMLDPQYKGLGMIIQYVGKQRAFQITNEYDREVLFPLLFCAYKILNPTNANERSSCSYTSHSFQSTSLYDVIESDMMIWHY